MQRRVPALVAAACCLLTRPAYGQSCDPSDSTLCVYELTPAEVAQFSSTDGQLSRFWQIWAGRDSAELAPPGSCYPGQCGFDGADDAAMVVKAAAAYAGLYLCFTVQDDVWGSGDSAYDCVEFYVDELDANAIFNRPDCLVGDCRNGLTVSSQMVRVCIGDAAPPETFELQFYSEALWEWVGVTLGWENARALYGIEAERVVMGADRRALEWFVPWVSYGKGIAYGTDLSCKRMGFCAGYNDMDGRRGAPAKLRWPNGRDPLAPDAVVVNYWGDVLLYPEQGCSSRADRSTPRLRQHLQQGQAEALFDLRGRAVAQTRRKAASHGVLIGRLPGGRTQVQQHLGCR